MNTYGLLGDTRGPPRSQIKDSAKTNCPNVQKKNRIFQHFVKTRSLPPSLCTLPYVICCTTCLRHLVVRALRACDDRPVVRPKACLPPLDVLRWPPPHVPRLCLCELTCCYVGAHVYNLTLIVPSSTSSWSLRPPSRSRTPRSATSFPEIRAERMADRFVERFSTV